MPGILTFGATMKPPAIPLLPLRPASAPISSPPTHHGNAVGPLLFGMGDVDRATWGRSVMPFATCA